MRMLLGLAAATLVTIVPAAVGQENASETKHGKQVHENEATRETEIVLRKHIEGMRVGKPIYDMMTATVAAAVKPYEEIGKARFAQLGAIRSVEFRGTSASGADIYHVQYENGASEYLVALTSEGKIGVLYVRPGQIAH